MVSWILTCTPAHVREMIKEGIFTATKLGSRALRISERSVYKFIEENKINPEDLLDPDLDEKKDATQQHPAARSRWMTK